MRLASFSGRAYRTINHRVTPLPEPRCAGSTLPRKLRLGRVNNCGSNNSTSPARQRGCPVFRVWLLLSFFHFAGACRGGTGCGPAITFVVGKDQLNALAAKCRGERDRHIPGTPGAGRRSSNLHSPACRAGYQPTAPGFISQQAKGQRPGVGGDNRPGLQPNHVNHRR
ncbi:hypothetical protein CA51_18130 [Rosistilla oblonga]|nr:hypothetical protein CA51_18130 [Rosistilla oblonga]